MTWWRDVTGWDAIGTNSDNGNGNNNFLDVQQEKTSGEEKAGSSLGFLARQNPTMSLVNNNNSLTLGGL